MMSWAYVRAVRDEQDERFWHVLWKLAGASRESYDEFHRAAIPASAAELVAKCLNCFTPPHASPSHRAPDIVVVLDAEHLSPDKSNTMVFGHRPHVFDYIIAKLREPGSLSPTFLRQLLGETRLIIFRTASPTTPDNQWKTRIDALTDEQRDMLQAISVFRFGFTQQMAGLIWSDFGVAGVQVRVELREFLKRGILRYAVGEYYIPDEMRWPNGEPRPGRELAHRHYSAGVAFAPYVARTDVPSLAFDRAFLPENVHEATFHFRQAYEQLPKNDYDPFRKAVTDASNRVHRFAEYRGWSVVKRLTDGGDIAKDAFEDALELLEEWRQSGVPIHPEHHRAALRAAQKYWKSSRADKGGQPEALLGTMRNLCEAAEVSCREKLWSADGQYCLLGVLAERSGFLLENEKHLPQPTAQEEAFELIARARKLLESGIDGRAAKGEWYEAVGDSITQHEDAEKWYELGAHWAPDWQQLWFKLCGCQALNAATGGRDTKSLSSGLSDERLDAMLKNATPGMVRDKKRGREWVKQRWIAGVSALRASGRCSGYRQVQLHVYERGLAE
jgi:hypothetical protein